GGDPAAGETSEFRVSLDALSEPVLRSHIAMGAQEVHTFAGAVRDNVALPVFDSTTIHSEAAVSLALGRDFTDQQTAV
ncbi:hypothetical protein KC221_24140, partial [Mycobacterium tuberculosis]|nr:hypothetical protein [Mycobacterium tuberculosis]